MANSIQYAKTVSTPSVKLATNELTGRVRVAFAEFEATGEQGTINMFVLPTEQESLDREMHMML